MNDGGTAVSMLHEELRRAMERLGYHSLLPIQEKSIPAVIRGYHVIIVAPTGSGKTEAALFPILSMMVERGLRGGGVKLVYITPLRALNRDLETRISRLASSLGFKVMVRHGDTGQSGRREFLRSPPDIMITTPESFSLLLTVDKVKRALTPVRWVVVDEFHELMESKRGVELLLNLEKLSLISRHRIQRIALSATLSKSTLRTAASLLAPSGRVEVIVDDTVKRLEYKVVSVPGSFEADVGDPDSFWSRAVKTIAEIVRSERGSVLIFTNTRSAAELLASSLSAELGERVPAHHGSLSRSVREDVERSFREGRVKAIVATSSLELGIDIGHVGLVVQFMSPRQVIAMTQRAGRSGHRLDRVSRAVVIVPDNLFESLEAAVIGYRASKGHLESIEPPPKPYDALAHFIVGAAIDGVPASVDEIYRLAYGVHVYRSLSADELESIVSHLEGVRLVRRVDGRLARGSRSLRYFYKVSMIPEERTYKAIDIVSGREVGEVSERFVVFRLARDTSFGGKPLIVLGGTAWKILDVDIERGRVLLSPLAEAPAAIPVWEGELIPVDRRVAREVCALINLAMADPDAARNILSQRRLPPEMVERLERVAMETSRVWGGEGLSERWPVVEDYGEASILYSCLGTKGNFALALLISKIAEGMGVNLQFSYIAYAIVFRAPAGGRVGRYVAASLKRAAGLDPPLRASLIYDSLRRTRAYLVRFYHVAKRMGVIEPDSSVPLETVSRMIDAMRGSPVDIEAMRELVHDKLDLKALNEYLDGVDEPIVIELQRPSPLALEVLNNPYMKSDVASNLKQLGIQLIIAAKRKSLSAKKVRMLCVSCLKVHEARVGDVSYGSAYRCPRCGSLAVAPIPPSEVGDAMIEAYLRKRRREKLGKREAKLAKEVEERATMHLTYSAEGKSRYVIEALSTRGVGVKTAKRLMRELQLYGEERFYASLIKAEEDYAANRRFWSTSEAGRGDEGKGASAAPS